MPDNDLWLKKIAAFLHDPPDKGYFFGTRDYDCLRYWTWITGTTQPPFYFNLSTISDPSLQPVKQCLQNNWHNFINYLTQTNKYKRLNKSELRSINIETSGRILSRFQSILKTFYNRKFHQIAASNLRVNDFGFKSSKELTLITIHPLDENAQWVFESLTDSTYKSQLNEQERERLRDEIVDYFKSLIHDENDPQKIFLLIWRNPPLLSLLTPPEPILPDNSLYDLETIQSAISTTVDENANPHPSFLILEFGPVQKFIANAQKTRDLWFGSWLISYLSWQAMKPIADKLGPDNIVYPDLYKQPFVDQWLRDEVGIADLNFDEGKLRLPTLPNTFLAIVKDGDEENYAKKVVQNFENAWKELVKNVRDLLPQNGLIKDNFLYQQFDQQTQKLPFDIYWLGLKWGDDPEKAIEDYKNLMEPGTCWEFGRLWGKMKERNINPNIGDTYSLLVEMAQTGLKAMKYRGKVKFAEEPWEKCSLCGERSALVDIDLEKLETDEAYVNSLIEKFEYNENLKKEQDFKKKRNKLYYKRLKDLWKEMSNTFLGHIKENEYLCAVCLVKRLAPKVIWNNPEKFFLKICSNSPEFKFDFHFPSTASIALAPFIKKLMDSEVDLSPIEKAIEILLKQNKEVKNFLDAHFTEGRTVPEIKDRIIPQNIAGERFDGDFEPEWFYDEAFPRFYEELKAESDKDEDKSIKDEWSREIEKAVLQIKKEAKEKLGDDYSLPKYYAAVYLDGDDLGKWLRGDKAPKIEQVFHPDFVREIASDPLFEDIKDLKRPVTPAIHRAISGALRDFALEVVPYVVEHNLGVLVYSGGDDTLFLIPLENLLDTLTALRKLYSGENYVVETGHRKFISEKGFIKIYENNSLKEIIRVMGTKATLSAGVAIAHYLDPLDITLLKAQEMLKKTKSYEGKNRVGFKVLVHSGSEKEAVVPWKFVSSMKTFKKAIKEGLSERFVHQLYGEKHIYDQMPEVFEAEFIKFGSRGTGKSHKNLLCSLISEIKRDNTYFLKPSAFLEALLITGFLAREEERK
ncbi:MAG: type III-B CRISPR-associated protein Cas10/Cmr2 [Desulfonauticus sp.]|nr:type III-B CRISPR-associated protein Cas10/Cmr2 [Desulfonauticus sp.]